MWILLIGIMIASGLVGWSFKRKFKKYSETPITSGLSGRDIASQMLRDFDIIDVQIMEGQGMLTDHYNPAKKTVSLSPEVYHGRSIASAAVAAHECGHAVQHAKGYAFLQFRSALIPVVGVSNQVVPFILLGGILLLNVFPALLLAGIILFAATTLFSFVTLPVEFDASNRALKWLDHAGVTASREHDMAKKALKAAAMTYVMAALASLATLLYYVSIFLRRN